MESSTEACFHGLRPQVRLTRMTPRDQTSLGAHRYDVFRELWSRHSRTRQKWLIGERGGRNEEATYLGSCRRSIRIRGPLTRDLWSRGRSLLGAHVHLCWRPRYFPVSSPGGKSPSDGNVPRHSRSGGRLP